MNIIAAKGAMCSVIVCCADYPVFCWNSSTHERELRVTDFKDFFTDL
jgi:hypothetical protein